MQMHGRELRSIDQTYVDLYIYRPIDSWGWGVEREGVCVIVRCCSKELERWSFLISASP